MRILQCENQAGQQMATDLSPKNNFEIKKVPKATVKLVKFETANYWLFLRQSVYIHLPFKSIQMAIIYYG